MVAFAPQTLGLEPENFTRPVSLRLTLCRPYLTERVPERQVPALSVKGRLERVVTTDPLVSAIPLPRYASSRPTKPPKPAKPPRFVETLLKAMERRRQIDEGEVPDQATIARREGIMGVPFITINPTDGLTLYVTIFGGVLRGRPER